MLLHLLALLVLPADPAPAPPAACQRFADYDGDGLADLYLVTPGRPDRLLRNAGDGRFEDVTESTGLAGILGTREVLWKDYDGDGHVDLYVSSASGPGRLLRNTNGAFVDETRAAGIVASAAGEIAASWIDYDADGRLDLYLVTPAGDRLFHGEGGGLFSPVELGIPDAAPAATETTAAVGGPVPAPVGEASASPLSSASGAPGTGAGSGAGGARTPVSGTRTSALGPTTPALACAGSIEDGLLGGCLEASRMPTLGMLFPLSPDLFVGPTGNVGLGTTIPGAKLDVVGDVRVSGRVLATAPSGAPFVVLSNALVANLNADQVDGLDASAFTQLGSSIEGSEVTDGTLADADLSPSAAIAGTKVVPNFGSQPITTSGALSAAGMKTQAGASSSVNVLGGSSLNTIQSGVVGGTVAGGGRIDGFFLARNSVSDDLGTVGGGEANQAGDGVGTTGDAIGATVAGGLSNAARALGSAIGGGTSNLCDGQYSCIPGGNDNFASGDDSLAAGQEAQALHDRTFVWSSSPGVFASTAASQFLIDASGGVGIGTNAPEAQLHVMEGSAGSVTANASSIAVLERTSGGFLSILGADGSSKGILFGNPGVGPESGGILYDQSSVASNGMQFRTGGNVNRMTITSAGSVGIGTNAPAFTLHVNGSAGKPGGGSWSVASDARLKKDIHPLEGALEKLLALRGVTFEYKDPAAIGELPGERMGMIAQEVEKVFPDWVEIAPDGYRRLTIRGFEALAVEALRELRDEKEWEIAALRAEKDRELAALAERVRVLEAGGARARPAGE